MKFLSISRESVFQQPQAKALIEGSGVFGNFACLEFKLTHYLNVWARSSARCMGFALVFWVICSAQLKPSVRMMD